VKRLFAFDRSKFDVEMGRQSRLLEVCLAVLMALFVCVDLALSATTPGYTTPFIGYLLIVATFALNRVGHYRIAAAIAMAMFPLVAFGQVYTERAHLPLLTLGYVALAPMLGAIFLPIWGVVLLTAMNVLGIAIAGVVVPSLAAQRAMLVGPLSVNAMVGVLASLYMKHRNGLEADRRAHLLAEIDQRKKLEDRLRQVQKMEALGQLAGGIAHDFNNVLTVILGNAALLSRRFPSAELQQIETAATSAAGLTRQLLAFGRKTVIEPTVVDVAHVVREAVSMMRHIIGESVIIEYEMPIEPAPVLVDRAQLDQVLLNLATNARDAMQPGGRLLLTVSGLELGSEDGRLSPEAPPGPYVRIGVIDDGAGMDEPTRLRIFEPFFTTKARGQGTGLGLATVLGIVAQSGGFINVWSKVGRGTRFELYFPRSFAALDAIRDNPRAVPPRAAECVLLLEDEPLVRNVVSLILSGAGYSVLEAATLKQARALWAERHASIGAVLTDVVLPDGKGVAFARELRAQRPELAVLCMSGYAEEFGSDGLPQGVVHLQKPFTSEELLAKLRMQIEAPATSVIPATRTI
jgi:signal transduction histidine kinase/ActR/RegA family two-component response regulator